MNWFEKDQNVEIDQCRPGVLSVKLIYLEVDVLVVAYVESDL